MRRLDGFFLFPLYEKNPLEFLTLKKNKQLVVNPLGSANLFLMTDIM